MSTQSNAMSESFQAQSAAPAIIPATRVFFWSVRRELWEYRSIYLAPLAIASVALFAFCLSSFVGIWEAPLRLNQAHGQAPFDMAAGLMMLTGIVVSVFYCLDALHGERRDRSILFWKSLPVSDATTVLLVSGWARRAPFLWAALPVIAIGGVEQIVFHTWHFATLVGGRLIGATPTVASSSPNMFPTDPMTHIMPGSFLSSPGLWIGLAIAAAFLAAAIRMRRYREPI
jgi:hypothetical protein